MITHDVALFKPESVAEAAEIFAECKERKLTPRYYSGGSEVVTMARDGKLRPGALIDLKELPEAAGVTDTGGERRYGANLRLSELVDGGSWPLLGLAAGAIADRTVRNTITLGGNICGLLPYREAVLPFLLVDTVAEVGGATGVREVPLSEVFDKRIRLKEGEFLLALRVPKAATEAESFYRRRQKDSRVDYPLVTLAALSYDGTHRFAASGAFSAPLRLEEAEEAISGATGPAEERARQAVGAITTAFRGDFRGTAEYRQAMLELALAEAIEAFEGAKK